MEVKMKRLVLPMSIIPALICLLFLSCSRDNNCEDAHLWDYPVKPGMEEWKQFQSNEEMVKACQIPKYLFPCLSTDELTDLCLQYPLLIDFYAFNNINNGLDKLFSDFNGIRELYKRRDVSSSLLKRYNEKIQNFFFLDSDASDLEKGLFIISVSTLEALLRCVETNDNEILKEILTSLVEGYERKWALEYRDFFRGLPAQTNFYSRAHIIIKISPESLVRFSNGIQNAVFTLIDYIDEATVDLVNELSYQLIN